MQIRPYTKFCQTLGKGIRNICGWEEVSLEAGLHNYFLRVQTEAPSEEGTEVWGDTEEFPNMDLKTDSGKEEYR